jgi:hypothetical protein
MNLPPPDQVASVLRGPDSAGHFTNVVSALRVRRRNGPVEVWAASAPFGDQFVSAFTIAEIERGVIAKERSDAEQGAIPAPLVRGERLAHVRRPGAALQPLGGPGPRGPPVEVRHERAACREGRGSTDQQGITTQRDAPLILGVETDRIYVDHDLPGPESRARRRVAPAWLQAHRQPDRVAGFRQP